MSGHIISEGKHSRHDCDVPASTYLHKTVWECDDCGRRWKYDAMTQEWRLTFRTFLLWLTRKI